jgi:hypothetical protein
MYDPIGEVHRMAASTSISEFQNFREKELKIIAQPMRETQRLGGGLRCSELHDIELGLD